MARRSRIGLVFFALAFVGGVIGSSHFSDDVTASHAGGADYFAFDMNPFLSPANTATSLGTMQSCARIDRNGLQDADEDVVDGVTVDVIVKNIPPSNPMTAFQYVFSYDEAALTVTGHEGVSLIAANPGSDPLFSTNSIPDDEAGNKWSSMATDLGEAPPEIGSGVLGRLTISADSGAASGVYALSFFADPSSSWSAHVDPSNVPYLADNYYGGTIAIGTTYCPRTDSDGDGVFDQDEYACAGAAAVYNASIRPERLDGVFAGVSDDGDAEIDELLPAGSAAYDCDGDGYKGDAVTTNSQSSSEKFVYGTSDTRPDQDPCGFAPIVAPFNVPIGWPTDLRGDSSFSANKVNIQDLGTFTSPVNRNNTSPGDLNYDARWDLVPGTSGLSKHINVVDLGNVTTVAPAMLGGALAYNGPNCPWPP